jgi:hypothetical protein
MTYACVLGRSYIDMTLHFRISIFFFEWIVTYVVLNDAVFWDMTLCDWWKYRAFRKRGFLLFIVILYFAKNDVTQFNCYTWNNFVRSLSFAPCVFISHLFHTHIETPQLWFEMFFTTVAFILILSTLLFIQMNATIHKIYVKMFLHVSVNKPSSGTLLLCFAKVMFIKIVS